MKPTRPQSYDVGPYIVRRDATAQMWRVFAYGVALYHSESLDDALGYAHTKFDAQRGVASGPIVPGATLYMVTGPQTGQTLLYSTRATADAAAFDFERLFGLTFNVTPLTLHS